MIRLNITDREGLLIDTVEVDQDDFNENRTSLSHVVISVIADALTLVEEEEEEKED
jgi:hypothetical protein